MNIRKSYQQTVGYIGVITKDYAKLSSRKCVKKCNNYSTKLPSDKNLKEMRQTLNNILPKENKRASGGDSSNLSATKFNEFFFASIAWNLCNVLKDRAFSQILVPRVNKDFTVDVSFESYELSKLELSKATGLDKIPAKLLQDAAAPL